MKLPLPLAAATAAFAFAAPLAADPMPQDAAENAVEEVAEAAEEMPAEEAAAQASQPADVIEIAPMPTPEEAAAEEEEERVICRSIRLDMSSRRKTRVCRTAEGWRELNQRR